MPLYSDYHIIDEQFTRAFENFEVKPYSKMWWRIASSLQVQRRGTSSKRTFVIAALLLLLGTSAGLFETLHLNKPLSSDIKKDVKTNNLLPVALKNSNEKNSACGKTKMLRTSFKKGDENKITPGSFLKSSFESLINNSSDNFLRSSSCSMPEVHIEVLRHNISELPESVAPLKKQFWYAKDVAELSSTKYFYLGGIANLNSTWLFDSKSIKSNNLKYESTFGISYGIDGGYVLSKHWGMQVEWLVNSFEGQRYKNLDIYGRTTDLSYDQKSISLTYTNVPVIAQYKIPMFSGLLNAPVTLNISFGGEYGRLLAFRIDDAKEELQSNHLFRKSEFASIAGFDYDFFTNKPVFYSLGLRASYSSNIFKSDVPNYFEFKEPHNFLIGLHGAVNFSLAR